MERELYRPPEPAISVPIHCALSRSPHTRKAGDAPPRFWVLPSFFFFFFFFFFLAPPSWLRRWNKSWVGT